MNLKIKLPMIVILGTLLTAITIGWVALVSSKTTITQQIDGRAEAVLSERGVTLKKFYEEIGMDIKFIAKSAKEASQGTQMASSGFEMVQGSSLEVNSASKQMSDAAKDLSMQAEALRQEVSGFIAEIRHN